MKRHFLFILVLGFLVSCEGYKVSTKSSGSSDSTFGSNSSNVNITDVTTSTTSSSSCTGTTQDGDGSGVIPLAQYSIRQGGREDWYPMKGTDPMYYPQKAETEAIFMSDTRFKVRIKVETQPEPTIADGGPPPYYKHDPNCPGRLHGADNNANPSQTECSGQSGLPGCSHRYEKLSFTINFYHSQLDNNGTASDPSDDKWIKVPGSSPFASKYVQGLDVGGCSEIVQLPAEQLNAISTPILVEVSTVRTDMYCQIWGQYCPSERQARYQECYALTLQVANDNTDDFK